MHVGDQELADLLRRFVGDRLAQGDVFADLFAEIGVGGLQCAQAHPGLDQQGLRGAHQARAVGAADQGLMEGVVGFGDAGGIVGGSAGGHRGDGRFQCVIGELAPAVEDQFQCAPLERGPGPVDIGDVVEAEVDDEDAAVAHAVQQSFRDEPLHRLADRAAGDVELCRQLGLHQLAARLHGAAHDGRPEPVGDHLGRGLPIHGFEFNHRHESAFPRRAYLVAARTRAPRQTGPPVAAPARR